jgi:hypothetical protein
VVQKPLDDCGLLRCEVARCYTPLPCFTVALPFWRLACELPDRFGRALEHRAALGRENALSVEVAASQICPAGQPETIVRIVPKMGVGLPLVID